MKDYPLLTLEAASRKAEANQGAAGADQVTIEMFAANLDTNLRRPAEDLRDGSYRPPLSSAHLDSQTGQAREVLRLGIQTVRGRVVRGNRLALSVTGSEGRCDQQRAREQG